MREKEMLAVVEALAHQPTAPFHEDAVRAEIEAQLAKMPHVTFRRDKFGNVVAHYRRGGCARALGVCRAHGSSGLGSRQKNGDMRFLGSVPEHFLSESEDERSLAISRCGIYYRLKFATE